ncbi:arginase family protein [Lachnospiraceae bacterium 54-53]
MDSKHINLIYPQWQGGGKDLSTYFGAKEFCELYLEQVPVIEVPVSTQKAAATVNRIFGYGQIVSQLQYTYNIVKQESPDTIFTVGGGCDANIPAVACLNRKLEGDMTVLWFDSHGDLNTPESSPSGHFYGMPLRTLLGEGNREIIGEMPSKLTPAQVVMMGIRDLDAAEQAYITDHSIPVLSVSDIEQGLETVIDVICSRGSKNIYIHIDLDVLEPTQFPYVPLPAPNGLSMDTLRQLLITLHEEFTVVGLGLMEYKPTGRQRFGLFEEITKLGTGLHK